MSDLLCYSEKYNVLLINIPKSASKSMNHALEIKSKDHIPFCILEHMLPKDIIENAIRLVSFRNPWERMVSMYLYKKRKGYFGPDTKLLTFMDYVKSGEYRWNDGVFDKYSNLSWIKTLKIGDMNRRIEQTGTYWDYIVNYDNIKDNWDDFRNKFNIDCPDLPHEHKAKEYQYINFYQRMEYCLDMNLVESVQNLFIEDIYSQKWEFGQKNNSYFGSWGEKKVFEPKHNK